MKNTVGLALLLAVCPFFMVGCYSFQNFAAMTEHHSGVRVTEAQFTHFELAKTPASAIRYALGAPSRQQKKSGREVWMYTYHEYNSNPMITNATIFQAAFFEFDEKGVLVRRWRRETVDSGE